MPQETPMTRPRSERALAWLYTGPFGHLWSAVADISVLWTRWIAGEAVRRFRARGTSAQRP
jgi:hypothetical protein